MARLLASFSYVIWSITERSASFLTASSVSGDLIVFKTLATLSTNSLGTALLSFGGTFDFAFSYSSMRD